MRVAELVERTAGFSFAFLQELMVSAVLRWVAEPGRRAMPELLRGELEVLVAQRASASAAVSPQR